MNMVDKSEGFLLKIALAPKRTLASVKNWIHEMTRDRTPAEQEEYRKWIENHYRTCTSYDCPH